jgi:uncharacterized SAM-binding protein YcdF (DUF218 family)
MVSLILAAVCFLLYRWVRAHDARRQSMAVLFLLCLWFVVAAVVEVCLYFIHDFVGYAALAVLFLAPLTVLFVAGILITNGLKMFRREGRSLGNSLSGLLGLLLIILPLSAAYLLTRANAYTVAITFLLFMICAQIGVSFLVFWTYSKLYARVPGRTGTDARVVLGSGLINGEVPPTVGGQARSGPAGLLRESCGRSHGVGSLWRAGTGRTSARG